MLSNMEHQVHTSFRKIPRSILGKVSPEAVLLSGKIRDIAGEAHGDFYLTGTTVMAFLGCQKEKAAAVKKELFDIGYLVKATGSRYTMGDAYRDGNYTFLRYPRVLDTETLTNDAKLAYCVLLDSRLNNLFCYKNDSKIRCASVPNQVMMSLLMVRSVTTISRIYTVLEEKKLIQRLTAQGQSSKIWITGVNKEVQFLDVKEIQKTAKKEKVQKSAPNYKVKEYTEKKVKNDTVKGESFCFSNYERVEDSSDIEQKRRMDTSAKEENKPAKGKAVSQLNKVKEFLIKQQPDDTDAIEGYLALVNDVMQKDCGTVRVQGQDIYVGKVQERFAMLSGDDLIALVEREKENQADIKRLDLWRLTALYTAIAFRGRKNYESNQNSKGGQYSLSNSYDYDAIAKAQQKKMYDQVDAWNAEESSKKKIKSDIKCDIVF